MKAGFPADPPPKELVRKLDYFREHWKGLTLSPQAPWSEVFDLSEYAFMASSFAGRDSAKSPEFREAVLQLVNSGVEKSACLGYQLLARHHLNDAEVINILTEQLRATQLQSDPKNAYAYLYSSWREYLLNAFWLLRPESHLALPELYHFVERVGAKDHELHKTALRIIEAIVKAAAGKFPDASKELSPEAEMAEAAKTEWWYDETLFRANEILQIARLRVMKNGRSAILLHSGVEYFINCEKDAKACLWADRYVPFENLIRDYEKAAQPLPAKVRIPGTATRAEMLRDMFV